MLKTKEQYAFFECILLKFIHFFFIQTPRHTTAYTSIGSAADKISCAKSTRCYSARAADAEGPPCPTHLPAGTAPEPSPIRQSGKMSAERRRIPLWPVLPQTAGWTKRTALPPEVPAHPHLPDSAAPRRPARTKRARPIPQPSAGQNRGGTLAVWSLSDGLQRRKLQQTVHRHAVQPAERHQLVHIRCALPRFP